MRLPAKGIDEISDAVPGIPAARWVRLGDVCELLNGRAYAQSELLEKGTPVLRVGNLTGGTKWYYSDLKLPPKNYCVAGDLLFAWSATFGPHIWNGPRAIFHYHIWRLVLGPAVDRDYLYYALLWITDPVKRGAHGVAMLHVTKEAMEEHRIPCPPLPVQRRIAGRLKEQMAAAERARVAATQRLAAALALPAAYLREVFEGTEASTWERSTIGSLCDFKNGLNFRAGASGHSVKLIGVGDFQNYLYAPIERLGEVHLDGPLDDEFLARPDDILFVRSNGNPDLVGRSMLVPDTKERVTFTGFSIRARMKSDRAAPVFLAYFFKSPGFTKSIREVGKGANIRNLSQDTLGKLLIALPPVVDQRRIAGELSRRLAGADRLTDRIREELAAIEALPAALLRQAFGTEQ